MRLLKKIIAAILIINLAVPAMAAERIMTMDLATGQEKAKIGFGTAGQGLISNGPDSRPSFQDWPTFNQNTTGTAAGLSETLAVSSGGTGKTSWTQYLIPYADTTTSFSQIAIGTAGQVLTSNGAGAAPSFQDSSFSQIAIGTAGQVLTSNGAGAAPSFQDSASAGANTALSNLSSVAINTSLVSDTDNTDDLGTSSKAWKDLYLAGKIYGDCYVSSNDTVGFTLEQDNPTTEGSMSHIVYGNGPVFHGQRADGTKTSPTSPSSGALLWGLGSRPYVTDGWADHSTAAIHFISTENISSTNQGTRLDFLITPTGTVNANRVTALRLIDNSLSEGPRIQSDFSNDTHIMRTAFQSSVANGNTNMFVIPNGTSTTSAVIVFNNSGVTNSSYGGLYASSSTVRLQSSALGTGTVLPIAFLISGSEVMRINNDSTVGIGVTSPSAQLHTTGTVRFANFGAGTATFDASGNISSSSDERLKDVQGVFNRGLSSILSLDPILYKWNKDSGMETSNTYAGFSAQNVQRAIPEAVGQDSKGFLTLSDRPIIAALVNAVKEQQKEIEELKKEIKEKGKAPCGTR